MDLGTGISRTMYFSAIVSAFCLATALASPTRRSVHTRNQAQSILSTLGPVVDLGYVVSRLGASALSMPCMHETHDRGFAVLLGQQLSAGNHILRRYTLYPTSRRGFEVEIASTAR